MKLPTTESKTANASIVSATVTVIFLTTITILADLIPMLKTWLADVFLHHWIGKGVLASALFLIVFGLARLMIREQPEGATEAHLKRLARSTIWGTLLIFAFFIYEAFLK